VDRVGDYIISTADYSRRDRLWPPHFQAFATNPLSLGFGACGTALFLHRARGGIPPEATEWLLAQPLSADAYPPGLYVGTAGVAYALCELGLHDRARAAMNVCYESPLLYADPTVFYGVAGWGLVSLSLHHLTGDHSYLERAADAVAFLRRTAGRTDDGVYWRHAMDGAVHLGFACGASGIAHFLLHASEPLGDPDLMALAHDAVRYDLARRGEDIYGWTWSDKENGTLSLPYFAHGSAGVGTTALRLWLAAGDEALGHAAAMIADVAYCKWTVLPSAVDGLAGLGEYMLDMHLATGRDEYVTRAREIAETLLWYGIERPGGLAFPGRWLNRVSTDYAYGAAGVGLFFHRLVHGGGRMLVDLHAGTVQTLAPRLAVR